MYRRRAIPKRAVCSTGLAQSQACSGCYKQWEAEFGVRITCVRMRCKDLGEDGQLCVVLLGWAALLSWHNLGQIVSGWWSSRQQRCKDACGGTESCGEDCIRLCVLCTQSALGRTGFRRHRRRDRLAVDVGDQDSRGHRRARAKYLKTENVWGVEESAANKGPLRLQHFIFYLDIAIVCCWAVCGLSTCAIYRQGSTWTNTAPTRFNVGLLVEAGDGGGGAPVPSGCSRTSLVFFLLPRRCGGSNKVVFFFLLAGDRPGTLGADRHCR